MKKVIFAVLLCSLVVIFPQSVVFAQEIYRDENGVWTNRPKDDLSSNLNELGKKAFNGGTELYIEGTRHAADFLVGDYFDGVLARNKKRMQGYELERQAREYEKAQLKRREFERTHISDLESYERFEDPRDKKD